MKNQHRKSAVKALVRKRQAGRIADLEINPRVANRLSRGFQIDLRKVHAGDAFYVGGFQHNACEASGSAPNIKNALAIGDPRKFDKSTGQLATPASHEMLVGSSAPRIVG
jgi:hypothetical protein